MFLNSNLTVNKLRYYTTFIMVAIYVALGLLFLFTDIGIEQFHVYRTQIGIVFLVYAAIRTFTSIRKIKVEENDPS